MSPLPPDLSSEDTFDLSTLNIDQRKAVECVYGPLLVLAGAGTGKTRVLTYRLSHIIQQNLACPHQILCVTFTNKAAFEMRLRVEKLIGQGPSQGIWMGTFHALALKIVRRHSEIVGLAPKFTVLDTDDQLRFVKRIHKDFQVTDKKWTPKAILHRIERWKDRGLTPEKVPESEQTKYDLCYKFYKAYQERLIQSNAVDFGDLLLSCLEIFRKDADVLKKYQQQFSFILVDEYQDTNVAQYLWLRLLAQKHNNICCVGDDDQSIYGWRGAEVTNILKFEDDFSDAVVIRLEQNYRSTHHILGAASGLIAHNYERLGKTLWTDQKAGEKVCVKGYWDSQEEARALGEDVAQLQNVGYSLSDMAILVRASYQTREFEERLMTLGFPYRVVGGLRFYERMEIRDVLAYLRLVLFPHDSFAFERVINTPKRGIGNSTLQTLHQLARFEQCSLFQATQKLIDTDELRGKAKTSLESFLRSIQQWQEVAKTTPIRTLCELILKETGYFDMWRNSKMPDAPGRIENIRELLTALEGFENLETFLEHVSLVMDNTAQGFHTDSINIMTLHSAKGLEFNVVFLSGWEEGLFPHMRALEDLNPDSLEEERRLAYVGITRARERAFITYATRRRIHGVWKSSVPSRFLKELPRNHIEVTVQGGLYPPMEGDQGSQAPQKKNGEGFLPNARVFHQKFGYGYVIYVEHDRLEIHFDHSGVKKVLSAFIKKAEDVVR